MATTVAELFSRVLLGFADFPSEWRPLEEIYNHLVQRLSVRSAWAELSSTIGAGALSASFTPAAARYDITSLIGKGMPLWIEEESETDRWEPLRVINPAEISRYYERGAQAAAFYAEDSPTPGTDLTQYVEFVFLPAFRCRIRFMRDQIRLTMADKSPLPDTVGELIVLETQNSWIPRVKQKIALNMARNEQSRKDLQPVCDALDGVYAQNLLAIASLEQLWKHLVFGEKGQGVGFNKPTPLSTRYYG